MNRNRKRPADTQEAAWVAGEDRFVLQQAKKRAAIRVKEGRAKPIDRLAVTLRFIEPQRNIFDDEVEDSELDVVDPEGIFEGLSETELQDLEKDIDMYASLETNPTSKEFWTTMDIICKDKRQRSSKIAHRGRSQESVAPEVEKLFAAKSYKELEQLERQIQAKLKSNEPIDEEYWETLLKNLLSWKARSKLRQVSQAIVNSQLAGLRQQQEEEATRIQKALMGLSVFKAGTKPTTSLEEISAPSSSELIDPEALLKARSEDKQLQILDENVFLERIAAERRKVISLGFVPPKQKKATAAGIVSREWDSTKPANSRNDEFSQATTTLYEREVARGVNENEEIFAGEEAVSTNTKPQWANKYRPRKPRYFNRVQMGYEWNKYNQTHYDHDHPPPKVVQGYKFNIFYPDLIDKAKAPTYKIERENGRKRGQSYARAGEEDTCLIRFVAGPPYEDIAFRIVDKEWDYSAKRERGFKSSFDKGILQLHFQFKKIFYRK